MNLKFCITGVNDIEFSSLVFIHKSKPDIEFSFDLYNKSYLIELAKIQERNERLRFPVSLNSNLDVLENNIDILKYYKSVYVTNENQPHYKTIRKIRNIMLGENKNVKFTIKTHHSNVDIRFYTNINHIINSDLCEPSYFETDYPEANSMNSFHINTYNKYLGVLIKYGIDLDKDIFKIPYTIKYFINAFESYKIEYNNPITVQVRANIDNERLPIDNLMNILELIETNINSKI